MSEASFEEGMELALRAELSKVVNLVPVNWEADETLIHHPLYIKAQKDPFLLTTEEELSLLVMIRKSKEKHGH